MEAMNNAAGLCDWATENGFLSSLQLCTLWDLISCTLYLSSILLSAEGHGPGIAGQVQPVLEETPPLGSLSWGLDVGSFLLCCFLLPPPKSQRYKAQLAGVLCCPLWEKGEKPALAGSFTQYHFTPVHFYSVSRSSVWRGLVLDDVCKYIYVGCVRGRCWGKNSERYNLGQEGHHELKVSGAWLGKAHGS